MFRKVCISACISMLLICIALSVSAAAPVQLKMDRTNTTYLLSKNYSRSDARMDLTVNFTSPGVILDTVGINAAPIGSWTLSVTADGVITFGIYDPTSSSKKKITNGWHILSSSYGIVKGTSHRVIFSILKGKISLKIDDMPADVMEVKTLLSGEPLYAGDFPGDDHWGSNYRIHPAMIGTVTINSFGPASAIVHTTSTKKPAGKTTAKPVVKKPVSKPVVKKPTSNTTTASASTKPSGNTTASTPVNNNTGNKAVLKPTPSDSASAVDAGIQKIKAALEAKDVERAIALTTGDARDNLSRMFKQHKEELPRLAALLANRKLVTVSGSYAEYELTENGRTFPAVFYKVNGEWRLASL